jgi:hypothetical protein
MKYDEIYYIGFDGGMSYGKQVFSHRPYHKMVVSAQHYEEGWQATLFMIEYYKKNGYNVMFKKLDKFLFNKIPS